MAQTLTTPRSPGGIGRYCYPDGRMTRFLAQHLQAVLPSHHGSNGAADEYHKDRDEHVPAAGITAIACDAIDLLSNANGRIRRCPATDHLQPALPRHLETRHPPVVLGRTLWQQDQHEELPLPPRTRQLVTITCSISMLIFWSATAPARLISRWARFRVWTHFSIEQASLGRCLASVGNGEAPEFSSNAAQAFMLRISDISVLPG